MDSRHYDAIEEVRAMGALKAAPGWTIVMEWVADQSQQRINKILEPGETQEFMKGEVAMAQMLRTLPDLIMSTAQNLVELFETEAKKEEETADG